MILVATSVLAGLTNFARRILNGTSRSSIRSSHPVRRATRLTLEALETRQLLSITLLPPNAPYPYTAICQLTVTFPDQQIALGAGVLVDSFHVLTAGHVIYSAAHGGYASSVTVTPELNGSSAPFGSAQATVVRTFPAFIRFDQTHPTVFMFGDFDVGLVTLNQNIGNAAGFVQYNFDPNLSDFAPGTVFQTAGYPVSGAFSGKVQYAASGPIAGLVGPNGGTITYRSPKLTTYQGESGSPIYRDVNGTPIVYGVHVANTGGVTGVGYAIRITQGIFFTLQRWQSEDIPPPNAIVSNVGADVGSTDLAGLSSQPVLATQASGSGLASLVGSITTADFARTLTSGPISRDLVWEKNPGGLLSSVSEASGQGDNLLGSLAQSNVDANQSGPAL
jgi:V8-like Glu-specific endopeptidase